MCKRLQHSPRLPVGNETETSVYSKAQHTVAYAVPIVTITAHPRLVPAKSMSYTSTCSRHILRSSGSRRKNASSSRSHRGSCVLYSVDVDPAASPFQTTKHLGSEYPSRSACCSVDDVIPRDATGAENGDHSDPGVCFMNDTPRRYSVSAWRVVPYNRHQTTKQF